ncbi:hypothetical protein LPMP_355340 [Leishmania panamensis]|uniref:MRH domain-containing protein n=3 Tax=Leishmania guyanensis species complex TaxID=38579 RepID=A0A088S382_LEIPA|nr:hypothetical protein LPMP_355340 [Leishmania panamensis]AIO02664.1 hypothetical protein LPMP_355340 [Leishmania panamensis]CCM19780.1 hypothetical protein, conserved [Leishmania guyanensis]
MEWRSSCVLWLTATAFIILALELRGVLAAAMDLSNPVEHNHFLLLAPYGSRLGPDADADGASTARYVQLSNGSRFLCNTISTKRRDPLDANHYPLGSQMESLMAVMRSSKHPCVQYAEGSNVIVYCWDKHVRADALAGTKGRSLGKRQSEKVQLYWSASDAFGRHAATVYSGGDVCPYEKERRIETEVRFYCRYSQFQNPIPYISLYESSQCSYVLRLLSSKFCSVSQLDHPREEETVRCQMLDD